MQVLQERMAKLREQNKILVEARDKADEQKDALEAQVQMGHTHSIQDHDQRIVCMKNNQTLKEMTGE